MEKEKKERKRKRIEKKGKEKEIETIEKSRNDFFFSSKLKRIEVGFLIYEMHTISFQTFFSNRHFY